MLLVVGEAIYLLSNMVSRFVTVTFTALYLLWERLCQPMQLESNCYYIPA
jgi:hypothetical protein